MRARACRPSDPLRPAVGGRRRDPATQRGKLWRLRDVSVDDVRAGKTWRLWTISLPNHDEPLEEWGPLEEADDFAESETLVYSAAALSHGGTVVPMLVVKQLEDGGYWGDTLLYWRGAWRALDRGVGPPTGEAFVANPRLDDRGFDAPDHDERERHREGFARVWAEGRCPGAKKKNLRGGNRWARR